MLMNILLTGAHGRLGAAVLPLLTAAGATVNAPAADELLLDAHVTPETFQPWLKGCDVVIHLAGVLREDAHNAYAQHLAATRALAFASFTANVKHWIHVSAIGATETAQVPWFAARGAADAFVRVLDMPSTLLRTGVLYSETVGRTRRFHPHALTLPWMDVTGTLPMTSIAEAAQKIAGLALGNAPHSAREIALLDAALPLAA
jgi:uncharacterized protein YbjT (DUF2867 family)